MLSLATIAVSAMMMLAPAAQEPEMVYIGTYEVTAYNYAEGNGENYETASGATPTHRIRRSGSVGATGAGSMEDEMSKINSQIRLPEKVAQEIKEKAETLGVSQNSMMIFLIELGTKALKSEWNITPRQNQKP